MIQAAVVLCLLSTALASHYQFVEEWHLWKSQHSKSYSSDRVSEGGRRAG